MPKKIFFALGAIALGLGAVFGLMKDEKASTIDPSLVPVAATIIFKDGKYSPAVVSVLKGEKVEFTNESESDYMWPASDLHPTHDLYPEFDPREPVGPGDSWSFVFDQAGEWGYHDHLRSSRRGMIMVGE